MLQLRPSCECCDKALAPESTDARICSFECTFCSACAESVLHGVCPNCGGELVARPRRPADKLAANPPAIAERKGVAEALRESELRWTFALQGSGDGVWDWNYPAGTAYFSTRWKTMLGHAEDEIGTSAEEWSKRVHPNDLPGVLAALQAHIDGKTASAHVEHRLLCKDGSWMWVMGRGMVVSRDDEGKPLRIVGTNTDITERKSAEERLQHMAQHDGLTGLVNRALFTDRLQNAVTSASRDKTSLALMVIDLDKFKPVNDQFGHPVGDLLLQDVAQRMVAHVRDSDTVARTGGDEFVVLLRNVAAEQDALTVAEKILASLEQPFVAAGHTVRISCCVGVALYPQHGEDELSLSKHADFAMYQAKDSGRNRVRLYEAPKA